LSDENTNKSFGSQIKALQSNSMWSNLKALVELLSNECAVCDVKPALTRNVYGLSMPRALKMCVKSTDNILFVVVQVNIFVMHKSIIKMHETKIKMREIYFETQVIILKMQNNYFKSSKNIVYVQENVFKLKQIVMALCKFNLSL
jgi:hypothetical protein